MKLCIIGTGYVGLVTGVVFADAGHEVVCVDVDADKIKRLGEGDAVIYEFGLSDLLRRGLKAKRLRFTTDLGDALRDARIAFCCVGTPTSARDGRMNTAAVYLVAGQLSTAASGDCIFVIKSTVPPGSCRAAQAHFDAMRDKGVIAARVEVVSNPEFLREGTAVQDAMRPDRVVLGFHDPSIEDDGDQDWAHIGTMRDLYDPFVRGGAPILTMGWESAELVKLAANAYLATRVSFVNELAGLCERIEGADVDGVRRGVGADKRIGLQFFYPGVGYGGSCFPKDLREYRAVAEAAGAQHLIADAADRTNYAARNRFVARVLDRLGDDVKTACVAVWGLAFKAGTDDTRESQAVAIARDLRGAGAHIVAHDPAAAAVEGLPRSLDMYEACKGADVLCVLTEWQEYRRPDWQRVAHFMRGRLVFDGRCLYDAETVRAAGFEIVAVGRKG